ncbi:3'-5' exonuclease [Treponema pedis]|uniref:DNA polymerase III n=2 Tax=Treponema pedis TaxID=409322 RepID=S6A8Z5_9SPIR|nr:3'-5' exonuclease [Treponema pedis]AGT44689.1 DNA polymerase III [Treponema pedis str. T A4]QOW60010.1 3'-5' exonuclease [Treponema pedis]QSI05351.1 3'-5' exonuclease [Treponema pedis]
MGSYDWISAVYDKAVFTAFDTETTGINPKDERVVEIGCVKFDTRGIIARYNVLINPEKPMPEEAGAVNKITDEMLADKPKFPQILPDFLDFIRNTVLVAHNAGFDISFINAELERCGKTKLTNKVFDTLTFAREVYPGLSSYALQNLAMQFGIQAISAHRAEDDARVCMEFFKIAAAHFFEKNKGMLDYYKNGVETADYLTTKDPEVDCEKLERNLF